MIIIHTKVWSFAS